MLLLLLILVSIYKKGAMLSLVMSYFVVLAAEYIVLQNLELLHGESWLNCYS